MKKVYVLINHMQVQDGVARTAISLINELAKREDLQVTIQSLFLFDPQMRNSILPQVKVKSFFGFYFRGFAKIVDLIPDKLLYRLLVREHYDVEIGFCMTLPIRIIAASSNRDSHKYAWMHGYDTGLRLLDCYKKMDKVITVSKYNEERFRKETGGTIPVVCCHNLIDDTKIQALGKESIDIEKSDILTFVAVGRLEPGKGILRLIECCGRLRQEGYQFRLWLIGDGEQRTLLQKRAKQLKLEQEIVFWGAQKNPHAYTSKADVLVCASYSEGYSTVCVEANILGIPVLTTNVSGAKEIIDDAAAGMVVGMEDEDLYNGIKHILDNQSLVKQWKQTLQSTRKVFFYENRVRELVELDI